MMPGVIDDLALKLAKHLEIKGVKPAVLKYKDKVAASNGIGFKVINFTPITPPARLIGSHLRGRFQILEAFLNIVRACKLMNVDLIHVFTALPAGPAAALYKKLSGKPFVITVTGRDVEVVKEINYGYRLDPLNTKLIHYALSSADLVICPSPYSRRFAIEAGAPQDKSYIIPYAINMNGGEVSRPLLKEREHLLRQKFGIGDSKVVLSLCQLIPRKNVQSLIKAFKIVCEHEDVKLIIAGKGSEEEALKALAHKWGLTGKVAFVGFIDEETKYDLMKLADVYVLPSLSDTFALSALEAMACGAPIIVTDRVGLAGFLKDGEDAIICKCGEGLVDELADGMLKLLTDEGLRMKIGERARERAREFSYERMSSQVLSVYEQVLRNV
jgi:glycosyltransferase involved in cell wall biosynthesis